VIESRFARLPSVPSTEHLNEADISVSSFFSLGYRPISVTTAYPPASTPASFASIFETPMASRKHPPSDVIQTLGSTIENIAPGSSQGDSLEGEWQVLHGGHPPHPRGTHSRASIPQDIPFSKFTSNLRPFSPPPVPEALPVSMNETKARRPPKRSSKPKAWSTTIIVTEITTMSGEKILSAVNTPFKRLPTPKKRLPAAVKEPGTYSQLPVQQPFLHRMRVRNIQQMLMQEAIRGKMLAISVKRQRKLKMKKHKYKKLMRRTRNQRRRLGRL